MTALPLMLALAAASSWETLADPALGIELLRPSGWSVETLPDGALSVRAPPPLGGSVTVIPVNAQGVTARQLVLDLAVRLSSSAVKEQAVSFGHAALAKFADGTPAAPWMALIVAAQKEGRAVVTVLAAPEGEFAAARPALTAIAQSVRLSTPRPPVVEVNTVAQKPLFFEPFREPKGQAFSGELPGDWEKELTSAIVPGPSPYVKATAIGRSGDNLFAFAHYKMASFQVPLAGVTPAHPGFRYYEAGAYVLERYLFPGVVKKAPQQFGEWKLQRRGGVQVLFYHPSNVRFDGEEVSYSYRFKGELMSGRAYVVTYHLPSEPSPVWYLYGLYGYEAPEGREATAKQAALHLLRTFTFEGRYAPQADMFWKLAKEAALKALAAEPTRATAVATPRKAPGTAMSKVEQAAEKWTEVKDPAAGTASPLKVGVAEAASGGAPTAVFKELEGLRP